MSPRRLFLLLTAIAVAAYLANIALSDVRSGSRWGIGYGTAAALLLLAALLLGARKRSLRIASRYGLGSSRAWLEVHIFGGTLFLLLMLMHSEFRLPHGTVTWWLWGLSVWTVLSGMLGLGLQRWIPRALSSGLSLEVLYERIPELTEELRDRAGKIAESCGEPVQALYAGSVEPVLRRPQRRLIYFFDITGGIQARLKEFGYLARFLSEEERARLAELEDVFRAKLEIDAHFTLQQPLRWWLYTHVPVSLLLAGFLILHLFSVLYY